MRTLVLVLTDVQGSTRLWAEEHEAMDAAMRRHHSIVHAAIDDHGGWRPVDQGEGDAIFAAFDMPSAAVAAVAGMQRALAAETWSTSRPLQVRVGMHVGEVIDRDGNLYGDPVNRCARVRALGSGGQSLMTAALYEVVQDRLPEGVGAIDLGTHRMKDLTRPERIWQLTGDTLNGPFPPIRGLGALTTNLPMQTSSFVGRQDTLSAVVASVREHRLVTVTGFGGMGKTRLAIQAAADLVDCELGDVWFVDLSAVRDAALVPARVAETLGVRWGMGDATMSITSHLAEHPALLLLDNLEQVTDCAAFVAQLLEQCSGARVLATSREPLRIRGEHLIPLAAMRTAATGQSGASPAVPDAVQLFTQRAAAVQPEFVLDNATAPVVGEICERLDGLPLAMELAAARLRVLSVYSLLNRLDSALNLLIGGSRDLPERQQTMRATIAWSYQMLSRDERLLLTRMAALPAAADLDMIEAVCGSQLETLEILDQLVNKSLVTVSMAENEARFGLLESIRQYAAEQLDPAALIELRDHHAQYLLDAFNRFDNSLSGYRARHARVGREIPHVRSALQHLQDRNNLPMHAELVAALGDVLVHRGLTREVVDQVTIALPAARRLDPPAPALVAGLLAALLNSEPVPRSMRNEAIELVRVGRQCRDPFVRAEALTMALLDAPGSLSEARELLADIDSCLETVADPGYVEERHNVAAVVFRYTDPIASERIARSMSAVDRMARPVRISEVLLDRGDWPEALELLSDATDVSLTGQENPGWAGRIATVYAEALSQAGRPEEARALLQTALAASRTAGLPPILASTSLADLERTVGHPDRARAALQSMLDELPSSVWTNPYVAAMRWRCSVVSRALGKTPDEAELRACRDALIASPLYGPRELLAVLVEHAINIALEEPDRAANLVATVQNHRGRWILPFGMDADLAELQDKLPRTSIAAEVPTQIW
jgi:predicted ATPase/class 3 adenylate cyclase